jgi:alpha-tubulin suppressor-like RCC1 family protein
MESEKEYTVERITDARMVRGKPQYRVRWEFFGAEEDTWEPAENLCNAAAKVEQFEAASKKNKKNKKKAGRGAPAEKRENKKNRAAKLQKASAAATGGEKIFGLLGLGEIEDVFVLLCTDCGLQPADLGRLGGVCQQLREWTESVAQVLVARKRGYRSVHRRSSESWAFLHFLIQSRVCVSVSAGDEHTLAVVGEKVFAFGSDSERQLGLGDSEDIVEVADSGSHFPSPREIMRLEEQRVVTVAAGGRHSVCLTVDGELFAWGYANSGQLGLDFGTAQVTSNSVVAAPRRVTAGFPANTVVSCVAAGGNHTACVTARGELFTWGDGGSGQLGHGDERSLFAPQCVAALLEQRIVGLDCGKCTTAAITATNELFMCGLRTIATRDGAGVGTPRTIATVPALVAFPSDVGVRQVSCGTAGFHFAAVGMDGVLYTWGDGRFVELGHSLGEQVNQPRAVPGRLHTRLVSCGGDHTACVTTAGALWTWGSHNGGRHGQLGHGDDYLVFKPKRVCSLPGGAAAQVTALSCGGEHTVAVLASGELCTFGKPDDGRLGRVGRRAPGVVVVEMPA